MISYLVSTLIRRELPTWVDHLCTVLQRNFDDLVTGEIGPDGCILATLSNDIRFVGLWETVLALLLEGGCAVVHTLPVHAQAIFIAARC